MVETQKFQNASCPVTSTKENVIQQGANLAKVHQHEHTHVQEQPVIEQRPVQHVIQEQVIPIQKNVEHDTIVNRQRMGEQVQVLGHEQTELKRQQELQRLSQNNQATNFSTSVSHSSEKLAPIVAGCQKEVVKDVVIKPEVTEHHHQPIATIVEQPVKQIIHQPPVVQSTKIDAPIIQHEKRPPMTGLVGGSTLNTAPGFNTTTTGFSGTNTTLHSTDQSAFKTGLKSGLNAGLQTGSLSTGLQSGINSGIQQEKWEHGLHPGSTGFSGLNSGSTWTGTNTTTSGLNSGSTFNQGFQDQSSFKTGLQSGLNTGLQTGSLSTGLQSGIHSGIQQEKLIHHTHQHPPLSTLQQSGNLQQQPFNNNLNQGSFGTNTNTNLGNNNFRNNAL
ncbi:hypothetical protein ABK040_005236 [Willaertia magna]